MLKKVAKGADRLEDTARAFLFKVRIPLFVVCATGIAFWARTYFWPFVSEDFVTFLDGWLNYIRQNQGLRSIGLQLGNYSPPYHYLLALFTYIPGLNNMEVIKITSTIADFCMAAGGALVVWRLTAATWKAAFTYAVLLFLPTVFLNSAAWGQCDAMYVAVVLFAIFFWLGNKKALSLGLYGLALAIKLQAIFILPAFVVFWLCGRLRLRQFFMLFVGYILAFLPAVIASGNPLRLFEAYSMQTAVHTLAPNISNGMVFFSTLNQEQVYMVSNGLVLFALLAIVAVAFFCWQKKTGLQQKRNFCFLFFWRRWCPILCPACTSGTFIWRRFWPYVMRYTGPKGFLCPFACRWPYCPRT
ncbi:MAG: glycosyltransferase 87 family protein [Oscillospiraceae bacterium]